LSQASSFRNIAWGAWIVAGTGALLFTLGGVRFFRRHHFGFDDALYCCLAIIPAGLLLLVLDYVAHHAKLVVVMPLFLAGMLVAATPVFDVALGLTLIGVIAGPAIREWREEKRRKKLG
jgi:hypothetical protein